MHPTAFFKYTTVDVAQKILSTQRLRWSSPLLFNDPFDCAFSLAPKFDIDAVKAKQSRRMAVLLTQLEEPTFDPTNRFAMQMRLLRKVCKGLPLQEVETELKSDFESLFSDFHQRRRLTDDLWKHEYNDLRVFCVSETNNNLLMWSHYADCHKGVVLQLECIKDLDVPLLEAKPVCYSDDAPSMATEEQWLDFTLGLTPLPDGKTVWENLVLTKATDWRYEREWRVISKRRPYEKDGYEDTPFDPTEVSKVFLGCRIAECERQLILQLLNGPFSHVEAFQAVQSRDKFAIDYVKIK